MVNVLDGIEKKTGSYTGIFKSNVLNVKKENNKMFINNEITLEELESEKNTDILREKLMTLSGVGGKVADCIMLFSLKKYNVFPIDVWVRRVMNELYIKMDDENKVSKKLLQDLAKEKYAELAGLAQQYLFYWKREA